MTRDNIIKMAIQVGFGAYHAPQLERFAALVAAAERAECAKVCEAGVNNATDWDSSAWDQACENRAAAIRARGQE